MNVAQPRQPRTRATAASPRSYHPPKLYTVNLDTLWCSSVMKNNEWFCQITYRLCVMAAQWVVLPPHSFRCRHVGFLWVFLWFTPNMPVGGLYMPTVNEFVNGFPGCSGISFRLYSHFVPSIPWIGSGSTMTVTRLKRLLKMDEGVMAITHFKISVL